jgi:two-component system cell cycle response regulator
METTNTRVTPSPIAVPEAQRVYLMTIGGAQIGALHRVREARTVIGRAESAQIRVVDEGISREHAELVIDGERVLVRDLSSRNGTFVNGARTTSSEVRVGDKLSLGGATFVVFKHTEELDDLRVARGASAGAPSSPLARESFIARVGEEISYARRHGESLTLLAWELVDGAALEERLGSSGLRSVLDDARVACSNVLRPGDLLSALGRGRFAVLLRRTPIVEGVALARQLAEAVARTATAAGPSVDVRVGVAVAADGSAKAAAAAEATLRSAEAALAAAHARGTTVVAAP